MADLPRRTPDTGWLARAPSGGLVLGGIASVELGGALAVHLFGYVGPSGAVVLRMGTAALVLLGASPPRLRGRALRGLPVAGTCRAGAAGGGGVRAGARRDDPQLLQRGAPHPAGHRGGPGVRRSAHG